MSGLWTALRRLCTLPPFETPEVEAAFWKDRDARLFFFRCWTLLAGIAAFAVFAVVDVIIVEGNLSQILTIRATTTLLLLGIWLWFVRSHTANTREVLIALIGIVTVIGNLVMILVSGPPVADLLPFSIAMVLAFGFGLVAPRFRTSVWTGMIVLALYWLSVPFSQTSVASVATNAHFLSLSIFAALVGTFVREKLEREGANAQYRLIVLNTRLTEADKAKDRLLASVSHELRTPINAIAGFSEVMQRGIFGPVEPQRYRAYADDIHTSALLLKTSIDDLLEISRLGMQKIAWEDSVTPLSDIVSTSVSICEADARDAGVSIILASNDTGVMVRTDSQRLIQTIINIVTNAIKFSSSGGQITIGNRIGSDGGLSLMVADTGCGIDPDDLDRIREPFGQAHVDQYSAQKGGLGLGLAIAGGFVARMGGRLDIDSQVGEGTTVSIILPPERISMPESGLERASGG